MSASSVAQIHPTDSYQVSGVTEPGLVFSSETLTFSGQPPVDVSSSCTEAPVDLGSPVYGTFSCLINPADAAYSFGGAFPARSATFDITYTVAGSTDPHLFELSFTVVPELGFDTPPLVLDIDSSATFTGSIAATATIDSVTATFAGGSTAPCALIATPAGSWSCTVTPSAGFPPGAASLHVAIAGSAESGDVAFTVADTSIAPSVSEPVFSPGQVSVVVGLAGDATDGSVDEYSWTNGLVNLQQENGCAGLSTPASSCSLTMPAGATELRVTQNWAGRASSVNSYNFRVPDAPTLDFAGEASNGRVGFYGFGSPGDLITVSENDAVSCTATVGTAIDSGSTGAWSCESNPLTTGNHQFAITATDEGSGLDNASFVSGEFGLPSTYVNGGISAETPAAVVVSARPTISYRYLPAGITVTGVPNAPGTVVRVELDRWDSEFGFTIVDGCLSPVFLGEGYDVPFPTTAPTICTFTNLAPGVWNPYSNQDTGDGHSPSVGWVDDYFVVPHTPSIGAISATADQAVTVSGNAAPGAETGDRVHVVNSNNAELCGATIAVSGQWACTSASGQTPGEYAFTAFTEDRGAGENPNVPESRYMIGGLSAKSSVATVSVSASLGDTGGATPTTPTWNFDVTGLNLNSVHPGDKFTVHGKGLPAGSSLHIELHSTPIVLGDASVAPDGSFTLNGTIPLDVPAGAHHLVATLSGPGLTTTTVEKAITVVGAESSTTGSSSGETKTGAEGSSGTEGGAERAGIAPNILTQGLNSIGDVVSNPTRISSALAVGLVLLIFAVLPAHLLNATIGEQYERFARRIPALRRQPAWYVRLKAFLDRNPVLGGLLVTTATALLFGFADPKFGFTLASLRLFLAVSVALFVVVYLANAIAGRIVSRTWSVDVEVNIRPLGLLLTLVGVIVSRSLDFSPGFLIGLVLGLTIAGKSAAAHAWKAVVIRSSIVIGLALIAWLSFSAFPAGEGDHATFWSELMLEILVAIATEGIVALLVELLPLHLLEGERLYKKSRVLWSAIYLAVITIFIVAVVPWEGNWEALGSSLWSWITVVVGFGAVCVAIYLYFRFLATPLEEEEHDGAELVSISDNDTEA
jgi:hypothetical protein